MDNNFGNYSSEQEHNQETESPHPLEGLPTFEEHMQNIESGQVQEETSSVETGSEFITNNITAEDIYRKIAKNALKNWNGLSDEEADKKSREASHDELENSIGAYASIRAASQGICKALERRGLIEQRQEADDIEDGLSYIYDYDDYAKNHPDWAKEEFDNAYQIMSEKLKQVTDKETFVLDILDNIHDEWIKDNMQKLNDPKRVNKRYQFMPLSLIGFREAKSDLIFVQPILEAAGMDIDEGKLEDAYENYNENVKQLFKPENRYDLDKYSISRTIANADPRPYEYILRNLYFTEQLYQFENDESFHINLNNTEGEDFTIQEQRKISVGPEWGAIDRYSSNWENQQRKEEAEQGWAIVTDSRRPTHYEYSVRYAAEIANQIIDKLQEQTK